MNRFILRRITHLDSRARDLDRQAETQEALETRRELCTLAREHLSEEHPWLIDRWLELAETHRQLGHLDQAERIYEGVLDTLGRDPRPDPSRIAAIQNTFGVFLCQTRQPRLAVDHFRDALGQLAGLPPSRSIVATLHNNLASALHSCGERGAARTHYLEALHLFEPSSPSLAQAHCHCDLAELLAEEEDEEDEEEALAEIERARQLFEELLVPESVDRATAFLRIADLYGRLARFELARPLLESASEVFSRSGEHPERLSQCLSILSQLDSGRAATD